MFEEQITLNGKSFKPYPHNYLPIYTHQLALQTALEAFGTRSSTMWVVLPVTAPPDTFAAVIRAGAAPAVLDVDPATLNYKIEELDAVLEVEKNIIVIHESPRDNRVNYWLQKNDIVSICCNRTLPRTDDIKKIDYEWSPIHIFDMEQLGKRGAALWTPYPDLFDDLKTVAGGILGLDAINHKPGWKLRPAIVYPDLKDVATLYAEKLKDLGVEVINPYDLPYPLVRVENARRIIADLVLENVHLTEWIKPLHQQEVIKDRWPAQIKYEGAESLINKVIALPLYDGIPDYTVEDICELLAESINDQKQ